MNNNFLIFDNFYNNVDQVREEALKQSFDIIGNYPGLRTSPEPAEQSEYLKTFFENLISKKISYWPSDYNTSYQYTTEDASTWIHHDKTEFAAVLYLTPDAPLESGTGIYRHKESGISDCTQGKEDDQDMNNWELLSFAGNLYNRLIIYRATQYHRSVLPGFGTDKHNGRLFQTFFFNTQGYEQ
jgi:hypothetical protein